MDPVDPPTDSVRSYRAFRNEGEGQLSGQLSQFSRVESLETPVETNSRRRPAACAGTEMRTCQTQEVVQDQTERSRSIQARLDGPPLTRQDPAGHWDHSLRALDLARIYDSGLRLWRAPLPQSRRG